MLLKFLSLRQESNQQSSELRWYALTIELLSYSNPNGRTKANVLLRQRIFYILEYSVANLVWRSTNYTHTLAPVFYQITTFAINYSTSFYFRYAIANPAISKSNACLSFDSCPGSFNWKTYWIFWSEVSISTTKFPLSLPFILRVSQANNLWIFLNNIDLVLFPVLLCYITDHVRNILFFAFSKRKV